MQKLHHLMQWFSNKGVGGSGRGCFPVVTMAEKFDWHLAETVLGTPSVQWER